MAAVIAFSFTSCKENATDKVNEENVAAVEAQNAEAGKFPVMTFEEKVWDFGTIEQGTPQEHVFTFTNTGESDLIIVDAKASCGCTVPSIPKNEPIAPGDSAEMLVKFNGNGKNQVSKTVTITANTESGKETVSIKAFINPKEGATTGSPIKVQ